MAVTGLRVTWEVVEGPVVVVVVAVATLPFLAARGTRASPLALRYAWNSLLDTVFV